MASDLRTVAQAMLVLKAQSALDDEPAFISSLKIEDKVTGGLVPFLLWDFQRDFIGELNTHQRLMALKCRQIGITWATLAHMLYHAETGGNRLFLIASQSGDDAKDALYRVKILYESQAEPPVDLVKDNTEEMVFSNGSRFESMKATKRAGRSKAAYMGLADEFAFWDWPDEQLAALDSACQYLYAITTGNGPGDLAHRIWQQSQRGIGRWHGVFYPWRVHPDRDAEWYRLNVTEAPEPRLARREYAASPNDAFATPAGVFFERWSDRNLTKLRAQPGLRTVRAVDFGFRHPAVLWIQQLTSGQHVVVREYAPAFRETSAAVTTDELAAEIRRIDAEIRVTEAVTYCDPAGRAAGAQTGESEFDVLRRAGLNPQGRPSSIRDGCVSLLGKIADQDLPLLVSDACPALIEALTSVPPDRTRPDLYDQSEASPYQHVLDALRYWVVNEAVASDWYVSTSMTGRRPS